MVFIRRVTSSIFFVAHDYFRVKSNSYCIQGPSGVSGPTGMPGEKGAQASELTL